MQFEGTIDSARNPFSTVGHSNRAIDDFLDILLGANVGMVVDVRRLPGSRACPQFDSDRLASSLGEVQIAYEHVAALGGRRRKAYDIPAAMNGAWRNRSFHNYADHALSEDFREGFERLVDLGARRRCAIMCSEAVWWRCHRRIIADYLLVRGREVFHLLGNGRIEKAELTPGAVPRDDGTVIYPAPER